MFNFLKKRVLHSTSLKIDLAFQYHNSSSNTLVLYNLGSRSIHDITIEVLNTDQKKFHANMAHLRPKIGELIKLNDLIDDAGTAFEGSVEQVRISIRGRVIKFKRLEDKFIQA